MDAPSKIDSALINALANELARRQDDQDRASAADFAKVMNRTSEETIKRVRALVEQGRI